MLIPAQGWICHVQSLQVDDYWGPYHESLVFSKMRTCLDRLKGPMSMIVATDGSFSRDGFSSHQIGSLDKPTPFGEGWGSKEMALKVPKDTGTP